MGGLWVDYDLHEHDPGPLRDRRGQLLRPRRQPPRRQRADAGPGRRLLRPARTRSPTTSPTAPSENGRRPTTPVRRGAQSGATSASQRLLDDQRQPHRDSFHRELGQLMWDVLRHGAHRGGPAQGRSSRSPSCARSSGRTSRCPAPARAQPEAREGRPGRRLPRARRADVPRRAAPRESLRRPLPRGEPDRDGEAQRDDEASPTSRPGSARRRTSRPCCTRSRSIRVRHT